MERRQVLSTAGIAIAAPLVGCLDAPDGGGNGNGDETGSNGGDGDVTVEYDVFQLGATLSRPFWHERDDGPTGFVALIESERDRPWMIDDPDEVEGLEEWFDETDFGESAIVYVETVGPNTCYHALEVSNVGVEDGEIVGEAEAVDASEGDVDCAAAVTYPSALVRVTGEDLPSEAAFTVTDGWGESSRVAAADGSIDPEALSGGVKPPGDPPAVPDDLVCDIEGFRRHPWSDADVSWGEVRDEDGDPAFAMRAHDRSDDASALEFGRGDEVRVTLRNVSDRVLATGNEHRYALEVLTGAGWKDVRGTVGDEPLEYTDESVEHRPGDGFEWSLELTERGVLEGHVHEEVLEVCPYLPEGRYRFAFRGVPGEESVAVAFDYTR